MRVLVSTLGHWFLSLHDTKLIVRKILKSALFEARTRIENACRWVSGVMLTTSNLPPRENELVVREIQEIRECPGAFKTVSLVSGRTWRSLIRRMSATADKFETTSAAFINSVHAHSAHPPTCRYSSHRRSVERSLAARAEHLPLN
jgi:hypothetical protein